VRIYDEGQEGPDKAIKHQLEFFFLHYWYEAYIFYKRLLNQHEYSHQNNNQQGQVNHC
jgi:hypothetical protein